MSIVVIFSRDCALKKFQNLPSYNLERVWCCTALKGSNSVAVGYDEGTILIKMGRDEPAVTMDVNGKLIWARHSELCQGTNGFRRKTFRSRNHRRSFRTTIK